MWSFIGKVALLGLGYFLEKKQAKAETLQAFYDFIKVMQKDSLGSVILKDSYADQIKRLKEKREAEQNGKSK